MEKISPNLKLKILALCLLSNLSIYLLAQPSTGPEPIEHQNSYHREGYTEVRIKGNLFTRFEELKEVSLLSHNGKIHIPFALLMAKKKEISPDSFNLEESGSSKDIFYVYLPKKYSSPDILKETYQILPYGSEVKLSRKKRKHSYEIRI